MHACLVCVYEREMNLYVCMHCMCVVCMHVYVCMYVCVCMCTCICTETCTNILALSSVYNHDEYLIYIYIYIYAKC